MYTIATAGHIDHGKSSLVKALTGTDPDRLPEEKQREMTIDLGFASFQLSTGEEVGIIDVPGHERFIKNMISGVGALDLVMFVVAADDGWMPQSEEHLAILRYLGIERGLIILTKVDMVDPDWKDMVKNDLASRVKETFLEGCDIIEFSSLDQRNLDLVKGALELMLKSVRRMPPAESSRLYIDRVFTIAGTGTVVTGTLREGALTVGQEVFHHPSGQKTKIKNLESFYSHLDTALPGVRLAIGLQALERGAVKRGDLLYTPRELQASEVLGVKLHVEQRQVHLAKHNRDIIFLHGTSEILGRLFLPSEPIVCDDGAAVAVLRLDEPVITKSGDRFILRLPTPSVLVGGGIVVDPVLELFKRTAGDHWQTLKNASSLSPDSLIDYRLAVNKIVLESDLVSQTLLPADRIAARMASKVEEGSAIRRDRFVIAKSVWNSTVELIMQSIKLFHSQNPHLASMPLATLAASIELPEQLFEYVLSSLIATGKLERVDAGVKLKEYAAGLSVQLEQARNRLLAQMRQNPRQSVNRDDILGSDKDGRKLYAYLKQGNEIVDLGGTVYLKETFDRLAADVVEYLKRHGKMTVAEARDVTNTSRKVILPLLEELDRMKITKRDGDYRKLWQ
jgi:selenocysteine-specific elongation factor